MSQNAEPKAKTKSANQAEWEAAPDWERAAVRKALQEYQDSPGNSVNIAMLRACRKYASIVNAAVGTIQK